tara:strand:- start:174 stop:287 length:114 start_codon:yes stop_codon:yes gene_type:complete
MVGNRHVFLQKEAVLLAELAAEYLALLLAEHKYRQYH